MNFEIGNHVVVNAKINDTFILKDDSGVIVEIDNNRCLIKFDSINSTIWCYENEIRKED